jgi:hypothetical protein
VSDRYYVSLTATCEQNDLDGVLEQLSAVLPTLTSQGIEGLSLAFTRADAAGMLTAETGTTVLPVALAAPAAGPVTSTGPGTPPPDATPTPPLDEGRLDPQPDPILDTSWRDQPATTSDTGQHADQGTQP